MNKLKIGIIGLFLLLFFGCNRKIPGIRIGRPANTGIQQQVQNFDTNKISSNEKEENVENIQEVEIKEEELGKKNPFSDIDELSEGEQPENQDLIPFPGPLPPIEEKIIQLELTGISWIGSKGFCIINHKILKEGDEVKEQKVTKIMNDKVILQDKFGMETELYIKK